MAHLRSPLADGKPFEDTEWQAEFTNWTLTGPDDIRALKVAGPGSVRVEEDDSWCKFTGTWTDETGFYSEGFAKHASAQGSSVTVKYSCSSPHDLYLGTSLYSDRATVAVQLDSGSETLLDCKLIAEPAVNTRRKIRWLRPANIPSTSASPHRGTSTSISWKLLFPPMYPTLCRPGRTFHLPSITAPTILSNCRLIGCSGFSTVSATPGL